MAIRVRGKAKINLGSEIEIEVEIFLIFVLKVLQVQKAISYQLRGWGGDHLHAAYGNYMDDLKGVCGKLGVEAKLFS